MSEPSGARGPVEASRARKALPSLAVEASQWFGSFSPDSPHSLWYTTRRQDASFANWYSFARLRFEPASLTPIAGDPYSDGNDETPSVRWLNP